MFYKNLFIQKFNFKLCLRFASSKSLRPHPRSYRRRLFEAALKPILPPEIEKKKQVLEKGDFFDFLPPAQDPNEYSDYEMAQVEITREMLKTERYRVMGICQLLYVKELPLWLATNQFRLNGLELKHYEAKLMYKVFEGTPFECLNMIFTDQTVYLFGTEAENLRALVNESSKHNWIKLLAGTFDSKIFSVETLEKFAKLSSMEDLRTETTQILDQIPNLLTGTLDTTSRLLINSLDQISTPSNTLPQPN